MRPFEGTVAIEGQTTGDGRRIAEGALTWRRVVPIFDAGHACILGHAYAVTREDGELRVIGSVDLPVGEYAVAATVAVDESGMDGATYVVTAGRLMDAYLVAGDDEPAFPAARIRVGRDLVDDRVAGIVRDSVRDAHVPERNL